MNQLARLVFEISPLIVFFVCNARYGIFMATGAFMIVTAVSVSAMWLFERRLPVMPLVSGLFVLTFGGLTLVLQDETFIKLKPTIVHIECNPSHLESWRPIRVLAV
mgnify:CR=1 FL=1